MLIADEAYQANIYIDNKGFISFKKVACDMGLLQDVPLISLHSISKGGCVNKVQLGLTQTHMCLNLIFILCRLTLLSHFVRLCRGMQPARGVHGGDGLP